MSASTIIRFWNTSPERMVQLRITHVETADHHVHLTWIHDVWAKFMTHWQCELLTSLLKLVLVLFFNRSLQCGRRLKSFKAICNFNHARKFSKHSRELCHAAVLVMYPRDRVAFVQFPAKLITVVVWTPNPALHSNAIGIACRSGCQLKLKVEQKLNTVAVLHVHLNCVKSSGIPSAFILSFTCTSWRNEQWKMNLLQ